MVWSWMRHNMRNRLTHAASSAQRGWTIRVFACQKPIPLCLSTRSRRQLGCFSLFVTRMDFLPIFHQGKQRCFWFFRAVAPRRCASSILDRPLRMPSWLWEKLAPAKSGQLGTILIWAASSTIALTTGKKQGGELGLRSKHFLSTGATCCTMTNCRQASVWSCSRR